MSSYGADRELEACRMARSVNGQINIGLGRCLPPAGQAQSRTSVRQPSPIVSDNRLTDIGRITQRRGPAGPAVGATLATTPAVAHGIIRAGAGRPVA